MIKFFILIALSPSLKVLFMFVSPFGSSGDDGEVSRNWNASRRIWDANPVARGSADQAAKLNEQPSEASSISWYAKRNLYTICLN